MKTIGRLIGSEDSLTYSPDATWVLPTCNVGIEVEVEHILNTSASDPHRANPHYTVGKGMWSCVTDGSLRNNGAEFVSRTVFGKDLTLAITALNEYLREEEPKHTFTHRTSVHIHLDVRDMTPEDLVKLFQLYCIFERALFRVSGQRYNNEYCIPMFHSHHARKRFSALFSEYGELYIHMQSSGAQEMLRRIGQQHVKYMGLNILPIFAQGSVEFRQHSGTCDVGELTNWINLIMSLKKAAMEMKFAGPPFVQLSSMGPHQFRYAVFGDELASLLSYEDDEPDMWAGAKVAQDIILMKHISDSHRRLITQKLIDSFSSAFGLSREDKKPKAKKITTEKLDLDTMHHIEMQRRQEEYVRARELIRGAGAARVNVIMDEAATFRVPTNLYYGAEITTGAGPTEDEE